MLLRVFGVVFVLSSVPTRHGNIITLLVYDFRVMTARLKGGGVTSQN